MKKKNRTGLDESVPSTKIKPFDFNAVACDASRPIRPLRALTQSGKTAKFSTPITTKSSASSIVAKSAPAGKSKSPQAKRRGLLSSTRRSSTPFTRVNPPTTYVALPFSIDAAVTGTVSLNSANPSLSNTTPIDHYPTTPGAPFNLYEEPEALQIDTIMDNSTSFLKISDKEIVDSMDDHDKENIPPPDDPSVTGATTNTIPTSRRNLMTDEPRTPLGELNVAEYYAEGYDSDSYTIVAAENEPEQREETLCTTKSEAAICSQSDANVASGSDNGWGDLLAQVEAAKAKTAALESEFDPIIEVVEDKTATTGIEIWEGASASAENDEAATHDVPVSAVA